MLAFSLAAAQAAALLRTVLVSRAVGAEVKGDAAILGLVGGFIGCLFVFNAAWQLVQSKDHDSEDLQSSIHGISVIRGLATTLVVLTASYLLLGILGRPDLRAPMVLIAAIPLADAATHTDSWRLLRNDRYGRLATLELVSPLVSLIVAIGCLSLTQSVWVIAISALALNVSRAVLSHILAERAFTVRIAPSRVREIIRYSWPLVPAGLCYWINAQSDQIIILASQSYGVLGDFDLATLGGYATVTGLVLAPQTVVQKFMQPYISTIMAPAARSEAARSMAFKRVLRHQAILSMGLFGAGWVAGVPLLRILLGPDFDAGLQVATLLVAAMALRLIRFACYTSGAAVTGSTSIVMYGNIVRLVGLPLAIAGVWYSGDLRGLALSVVVAEFLTAGFAGVLLSRSVPGAGRGVLFALVLLGLLSVVAESIPR